VLYQSNTTCVLSETHWDESLYDNLKQSVTVTQTTGSVQGSVFGSFEHGIE